MRVEQVRSCQFLKEGKVEEGKITRDLIGQICSALWHFLILFFISQFSIQSQTRGHRYTRARPLPAYKSWPGKPDPTASTEKDIQDYGGNKEGSVCTMTIPPPLQSL